MMRPTCVQLAVSLSIASLTCLTFCCADKESTDSKKSGKEDASSELEQICRKNCELMFRCGTQNSSQYDSLSECQTECDGVALFGDACVADSVSDDCADIYLDVMKCFLEMSCAELLNDQSACDSAALPYTNRCEQQVDNAYFNCAASTDPNAVEKICGSVMTDTIPVAFEVDIRLSSAVIENALDWRVLSEFDNNLLADQNECENCGKTSCELVGYFESDDLRNAECPSFISESLDVDEQRDYESPYGELENGGMWCRFPRIATPLNCDEAADIVSSLSDDATGWYYCETADETDGKGQSRIEMIGDAEVLPGDISFQVVCHTVDYRECAESDTLAAVFSNDICTAQISDPDGNIIQRVYDNSCDGSRDICEFFLYDNSGEAYMDIADWGCDGSVEYSGV